MNQETQLLTPNQVSRILGIKRHTLAVWRCTGRYNLPFVKSGRLVKYHLKDVEAFIERQTRTNTGLVEAAI